VCIQSTLFGERGNTQRPREGKDGETERGEARDTERGEARETERWEGRQGTLYTLQAKLFGEQKRVRKRTRDDEKKSREGATEIDPSEKNSG
jgi:hypothetical protein